MRDECDHKWEYVSWTPDAVPNLRRCAFCNFAMMRNPNLGWDNPRPTPAFEILSLVNDVFGRGMK